MRLVLDASGSQRLRARLHDAHHGTRSSEFMHQNSLSRAGRLWEPGAHQWPGNLSRSSRTERGPANMPMMPGPQRFVASWSQGRRNEHGHAAARHAAGSSALPAQLRNLRPNMMMTPNMGGF